MTALFIADLHLSDTTKSLNQAFSDFVQTTARNVDQLFILGDLFEAWLGDNDDSDIGHFVAEHIRSLSDNGTQVFLMRGNRDFMLSQRYCESLGANLLDNPTTLELEGQNITLLHGDTLCTDDIRYQRFRRIIQHPVTLGILGVLPLAVRKRISKKIRGSSSIDKANKPENIMDVADSAVQNLFFEQAVNIIIHGHTHRPRVHEYGDKKRYVLGDWGEKLWYLQLDEQGFNLHSQACN